MSAIGILRSSPARILTADPSSGFLYAPYLPPTKPRQFLSLLFAIAASSAGAAEEYTLTDISGWTPAPLSTLPHFDRYVPVLPAGASTDFTPVCSNGLGLVAGDRSDPNGNDESFTTTWDWTIWAIENLGSSNPNADSNENGLPDAIEYATGTAPPPMATFVDGQLQFHFRRALFADGVTIIVQVSQDLRTWIDGSSYSLSGNTPDTSVTTELSRTPDESDGETITIAVETARFARLKTQLSNWIVPMTEIEEIQSVLETTRS